MSTKPLYLSDLDGTLLNAQGVLSERTRGGLRTLIEGGMHFTVASARGHFSISELFGDMVGELSRSRRSGVSQATTIVG